MRRRLAEFFKTLLQEDPSRYGFRLASLKIRPTPSKGRDIDIRVDLSDVDETLILRIAIEMNNAGANGLLRAFERHRDLLTEKSADISYLIRDHSLMPSKTAKMAQEKLQGIPPNFRFIPLDSSQLREYLTAKSLSDKATGSELLCGSTVVQNDDVMVALTRKAVRETDLFRELRTLIRAYIEKSGN